MRKLFLFGVVLFAPWASAQETYSINANANQVTDLTDIVRTQNGQVCERTNLALDCTQAQACTAAGVAGGASCTAAAARAANVRIFPLTQAGREEFVTFGIAAPRFVELRAANVPAFAQQQQCKFWSAPTTTRTQKDAMCTAANLPTGCQLCP